MRHESLPTKSSAGWADQLKQQLSQPQPVKTERKEDDRVSIHKSKPLTGYTIVPNSVAQDRRLTGLARGVLVYFLSLPDDWVIRMPKVQEEFGIKRDLMRKVFRELEAIGHMRLVPSTRREDGSVTGNQWKVYADPSENPTLQVDSPTVGRTTCITKELSGKKRNIEERVSVPSLRSETPTKSFPSNDSNPQNDSGPPKAEKKEKSASVAARPPAPRLRLIPPSREQFDAYIEECCPHLYDKGINSFDQLQEDNWHEWKRGRWNPINFWQAWVDGTERTVRNSTFGENR